MTVSYGGEAPLSAALYAEAFGGSADEAAHDLEELRRGEAVPFSLTEGERVLSQGIGIPLWSETADGKACPLLYLYALVTEPASRGQGLLRTLLREVKEQARRSAYAALCLLPADAALAAAYERLGFTEHLPAGGGAALSEAADFSLRFRSVPAYRPCPADELRIPLGMALYRPLFSYAVASLGDRVIPCRVGKGHALLFKDDPRYALAVTQDLMPNAERVGSHEYLLAPLRSHRPAFIPEPLPR